MLSWKPKIINIIANFAAENMGKKEVICCREVKNCYIAWSGVFRNAINWKAEVQQDCSPSGSRQIQDLW